MSRQETSAPQTRIVDALSGHISTSPGKFFDALAEADAEVAAVHELRCRVQELEAENAALVVELNDWRLAAQAEADGRNRFKAERDRLEDQLFNLLGLLADAQRGVTS